MRSFIISIFILILLSGCSNTRKVARSISDIFKKEESRKSDSTVNKTKDSTVVKQSIKTAVATDSSGYEKEIEENIIEWIIVDSAGNEVKKIVTKKVTKEKGQKKITTTTEKVKSDSAHLKKTESTNLKKDTSSKMEQGRWEVTKEKQVKKAFPGWAWLVGGLLILLLLLWFLRQKLYLIFPFLKPKRDDT